MPNRFFRVTLVAGFALVVSCDFMRNIQDTTDKAIGAIEVAINKLENQSTNWQATLTQLEKDLVDQAQSTLAHEVQDLMTRGIATGGTELRCNMDFIGHRMRQGLERMLAKLQKKPVPPLIPAFCQVVPTVIDLGLAPERRTRVEIYGYDMDVSDANAIHLFIQDGRLMTPVPSTKIARPTHYLMTINISDTNGIDFSSTADQLVIRAGASTTLGTIAIIQKPAPTACGAANQRCCTLADAKPPCGSSLQCVAGVCRTPPCGGLGQPVCATSPACQGGLTNIQGTCKQLTMTEHTGEGCGENVMRWASASGSYVSVYKGETKSFYVVQGGNLIWHCGTSDTNDRTGCPSNTNWVRVARPADSRDVDVTCYSVTP
jgi:hypothetical protein